MTQVLVNEYSLYEIAEAIREANGSETSYKPSQMAAAISALELASDVDLGTKTISSNGTYAASGDSLDGFSSVTVNVPNTYAAGDEGKVVSSGALVAQTSVTKTANGTYDTTTNNEVVVAIPSCDSTTFTGTVSGS